MSSKEKINKYFDEQRASYDKELTECLKEAKNFKIDEPIRKYYEDRAWSCGNMVLKMTSIEQQILKLI